MKLINLVLVFLIISLVTSNNNKPINRKDRLQKKKDGETENSKDDSK